MSRNTYIFAGGGTGGHLYPGLAVADELRRVDEDAVVVFACSNRSIDRQILDSLDYPVVPQPVLPLPKSPLKFVSFLRAWKQSKALASTLLNDLKPHAVLGLGGFAAGPVVQEAAKKSVPTAMLNPDSIPGKANRFLAPPGRCNLHAVFIHDGAFHVRVANPRQPRRLSGQARPA